MEWNGGKIHKIRKSIYHLMSGEVFEICGKKFFVMGGASSRDKEWRIPGVSWWADEIPSRETMEYGLENLKNHNNKVDYILSHCTATKIQKQIDWYYKSDILTDYFDYIYDNVEFEKWFCGHYHRNENVDKVNVLYNDIMRLV